MKRLPRLLLPLATLPVLIWQLHAAGEALPPPPTSKAEASAVKAFAQDMQAVKDWVKAEQNAALDNDARYQRIPERLPEQLAKVRADGLPAALAKPFAALRTNAVAHAALLGDIPADDARVAKWLETKLADVRHNEAVGELIGRGDEIQSELISAGVEHRIGRQVDIRNVSQIEDRWVVILSANKAFKDARADAERFAKASGVPFSMNGMIHDKKGLRYPDNHEDEVLAGTYVSRRFNGTTVGENVVEQHLSIEKSEDYQGFAPGYYIVVGCIAESAEEGKAQAATFRKHAPGAYAKKTEIFLGCMH